MATTRHERKLHFLALRLDGTPADSHTATDRCHANKRVQLVLFIFSCCLLSTFCHNMCTIIERILPTSCTPCNIPTETNYQTDMANNTIHNTNRWCAPCAVMNTIYINSCFAALKWSWDHLVCSLTAAILVKSTGWHHNSKYKPKWRTHGTVIGPFIAVSSSNQESLPSQLLFRYTDTNTGGTVKKSTTEFTSNQNHSLSLAAINCKKQGFKMRFCVLCT